MPILGNLICRPARSDDDLKEHSPSRSSRRPDFLEWFPAAERLNHRHQELAYQFNDVAERSLAHIEESVTDERVPLKLFVGVLAELARDRDRYLTRQRISRL